MISQELDHESIGRSLASGEKVHFELQWSEAALFVNVVHCFYEFLSSSNVISKIFYGAKGTFLDVRVSLKSRKLREIVSAYLSSRPNVSFYIDPKSDSVTLLLLSETKCQGTQERRAQ